MLRAAVLACVFLGLDSPVWAQANECAQTWTFDGAMHTLRNGVDAGGVGHPSAPFYRCVGGNTIWVIGQDGKTWWRYTAPGWVGPSGDPGGVQFLGAGPGAVPNYTVQVGEVVSLAWDQDVSTLQPWQNVSWRVAISSQPVVTVPLSAMVGGTVKVPFATATPGDYEATVSVVGCVMQDAVTQACLQTSEVPAAPITVRVFAPAPPPITPRNLVVRP